MSTNNRTMKQAADQNLIDGITKHEKSIPSFLIRGTSYKAADVIGIVQAQVNAAKTTFSTRAIWQNAVKAERDERAKNQPFVSALRQTLQAMFSDSVDSLADFGLTPRKPRVITPAKKAAAALKAKATRDARHTMGKNQKKDIKGAAPATTPATHPSTGSPAPATTAPAVPPAPAPTLTIGPSPMPTPKS
jgi:hypothetical protein